LVYDTGSGSLVVTDIKCEGSGCENGGIYDPTKSTTKVGPLDNVTHALYVILYKINNDVFSMVLKCFMENYTLIRLVY
jgi:hypothetical protein